MRIIQVSYEYRSKGVGKQLFILIAESARRMGAKKIYISAHSSEESQAFYKAIGCVEAEEYNRVIAENEPYDCKMEHGYALDEAVCDIIQDCRVRRPRHTANCAFFRDVEDAVPYSIATFMCILYTYFVKCIPIKWNMLFNFLL